MPGHQAPQQIREFLIGGIRPLSQVLQRRSQAPQGRCGEPPGVLEPGPYRGSRGRFGQAQVDGQPGRQDLLDGAVVQFPGQAAPLDLRGLLPDGQLAAVGDLGHGGRLRPE
jgi:hypothetical protein